MTGAIGGVTTAQNHVRRPNSDFDGFAISEGDYLALLEGKLFGTDRDINALLELLARQAGDKGAEFIHPVLRRERHRGAGPGGPGALCQPLPDAELSVLRAAAGVLLHCQH